VAGYGCCVSVDENLVEIQVPRIPNHAPATNSRRTARDPYRSFVNDGYVEGNLCYDRREDVESTDVRRGRSDPNSNRALHCVRECMQHEATRKIAQ